MKVATGNVAKGRCRIRQKVRRKDRAWPRYRVMKPEREMGRGDIPSRYWEGRGERRRQPKREKRKTKTDGREKRESGGQEGKMNKLRHSRRVFMRQGST